MGWLPDPAGVALSAASVQTSIDNSVRRTTSVATAVSSCAQKRRTIHPADCNAAVCS